MRDVKKVFGPLEKKTHQYYRDSERDEQHRVVYDRIAMTVKSVRFNRDPDRREGDQRQSAEIQDRHGWQPCLHIVLLLIHEYFFHRFFWSAFPFYHNIS